MMRQAPDRYAAGRVDIARGADGAQVVVSTITDGDGRTVFALIETMDERHSAEQAAERAKAAIARLAAAATRLKPQHWMPGGRHVVTVSGPDGAFYGITVIEADKWILSAPVAKTPDGDPDGPIEIAYPASLVGADGVAEQAYAMTRSVYQSLVAQGIIRAIEIGDALRAHRTLMRAGTEMIG